jgi:hypothetical protein
MEIIPKEKSSKKDFNILFYISLILLFFSIVSFFILNHLSKQTQKERERLDVLLIQKLSPEKLALKQEVLNYQKKIDNFSFLIDQQLKSSKFFTEFEKIIHPQVWFSNFNLNLKKGIVTLSGYAQSFEILEQQFFVFENTNWIKNFDTETILIGEERRINFSLIIFFNPMIFQ